MAPVRAPSNRCTYMLCLLDAVHVHVRMCLCVLAHVCTQAVVGLMHCRPAASGQGNWSSWIGSPHCHTPPIFPGSRDNLLINGQGITPRRV